MDTILVSLFTVIMLIVSTLVMVASSISSLNKISESYQVMEQRSSTLQRSGLDVSLNQFQDGCILLNGMNTGQTDLAEFPSWSVLLQHADGSIEYLAFTDALPPAPGCWAVDGIFLGQDPEVFGPQVLNPDEEAHLIVNPATPVGGQEAVRITVMTSGGVAAECQVARQG
jgi:hypothetical protein